MKNAFSKLIKWIDLHRTWLWLILSFIFVLCVYPITWKTNDDVGLMMYVNGFGLTPYSTSHLIFSTSLWGHLLRWIPNFGEVTGYAVVILGLAFAAVAYIQSILLRRLTLDAGDVFALLMLLGPAVFSPQFSVTSGFCAVAGVFGIHHSLQSKERNALYFGLLFCLLGFLIRPIQSAFVFIVCFPFVAQELWQASRRMKLVFLGFTFLLIGVWSYDYFYFKNSEWSQFSRFEQVRPSFTDYGVPDAAAKDGKFPEKTGYSFNDLKLLKSWFFLNPALHDAERLNSVLQMYRAEVGFQPHLGWQSINKYFGDSYYWFFVLILVTLLGVKKEFRWRGVLSILFAVILIFVVGAVSKSVPWRVYFPTYLCFFAFLMYHQSGKLRVLRSSIFGLLFVFFVYDAYNIVPTVRHHVDRAQSDLRSLPSENLYFVWSDRLLYELIYAPLKTSKDLKKYRLFSISSGSLRPPSFALLREAGFETFDQALTSGQTLSFIMSEYEFQLLKNYCSEHFQSQLNLVERIQKDTLEVYKVKCEKTM